MISLAYQGPPKVGNIAIDIKDKPYIITTLTNKEVGLELLEYNGPKATVFVDINCLYKQFRLYDSEVGYILYD